MYYWERSGDPYTDFDRREEARQRWLDRLPRCCECDEPIQDEEYYEFDGKYICPHCLDENHAKYSEDF